MKTTLVCVVNGEVYEKFAEGLFSSAEKFFHPTDEVEFLMLPGRSGWPDATMYRYHVLCEGMPDSDYVFMSDADMVFESEVGREILPVEGLTATIHPGYVNRTDFPYEKREGMLSMVAVGKRYYCGGFIGGTESAMLSLSICVALIVDHDVGTGRIPLWHDESVLNAVLAQKTPEVALPPSYCYPDDDTWYLTQWSERYKRKLVALDKTGEQRGDRAT